MGQVCFWKMKYLGFVLAIWRLFVNLRCNVCTKFHGNMGYFLKPIYRNHNIGVFLTWYFVKTHKKGIYIPPPLYNALAPILSQFLSKWVHFAEMLDSFESGNFFFVPLNLWIFIKRVNSLLFEHISCFLKNRTILKGFIFFSLSQKRVLLKC